MGDFLAFRKMITPGLIQVLFWLGVLFCIVVGVAAIAGGTVLPVEGGSTVLAGFVILLLGPIVVRVYCELLMVLFRIHDSIGVIEKNTARS